MLGLRLTETTKCLKTRSLGFEVVTQIRHARDCPTYACLRWALRQPKSSGELKSPNRADWSLASLAASAAASHPHDSSRHAQNRSTNHYSILHEACKSTDTKRKCSVRSRSLGGLPCVCLQETSLFRVWSCEMKAIKGTSKIGRAHV